MKYGVLVNRHAWWLGAHYSPYNKRLCITLCPCVTFWIVWPGGNTP